MCGIAGLIGGAVEERQVAAMVAALAPRGPDGSTVQRVAPHCVLGHARLAIVDLSTAARQPLAAGDGRYWAVVNGEIYNHRPLRQQLEQQGHRFRSHCDSEVVAHGYAQWGPALLHRLEGIFALAIYDSHSGELLLARDPAGVKPLYYAPLKDGIAFASELKGLRAVATLPLRFAPESLYTFLAYRYLPAPLTPYHGIHKLPPGHTLAWGPTGNHCRPYWQPRLQQPPPAPSPQALQQQLAEVVAAQLLADVPSGVLLSGGIDSSAIAAYARDAGGPLPAYCCGFAEPSHDERPFARTSATHLDLPLHETLMGWPNLLAALPQFIDWFDEPFFDYSAVAVHQLCQLARGQGVKVLLAGDGADELFCGYLWYDRFAALPPQPPAAALAHYFGLLGYFTQPQLSQLAGREVAFDHLWLLRHYDRPELPATSRAQWLDFHTFLPDDILAKVDRASMAAGVEVRVPFLDQRLLNHWFLWPPEQLYQQQERKALLKRALAERLPASLLTARKKGFGFPLEQWQRPIRAFATPLLQHGALLEFGYACPSGMAAALGQFDIHHLWLLLMAELWLRRYLRGEALDPLVARHLPPAAAP